MLHFIFKHLLMFTLFYTLAHAQENEILDDINVDSIQSSPQIDLDIDLSSSSGIITKKQLENRPLLRPTEVLETIPGLTVTQHSGAGKANQYFLRGFSLDHGTDFYTRVEGIPINLPTHAHGQGYLDLNFLIPELIDNIEYTKGPYFADLGDFSSTGSANIKYKDTLESSTMSVTYGSDDYARLFNMGSFDIAAGKILYGIEVSSNNGPWEEKEKSKKLNGIISYSQQNDDSDFKVSYMGYDAKWNATNQVPLRAIENGDIGRFGNLDASDGGDSNRQSLTTTVNFYAADDSITSVNTYASKYSLNLYSNFTFYLNNPIEGDQIYQKDDRTTYGGEITNLKDINIKGFDFEQYYGTAIRYDDIEVGLFNSQKRKTLNTVSNNHMKQTNLSFFYQIQIPFEERYKVTLGLRDDIFKFNGLSYVNSADSGTLTTQMLSPKIGFVSALNDYDELFINAGMGLHSNDARGVLLASNPATPLVRTKGYEIGWQRKTKDFLSSVTLWNLQSDSELVFAGDYGTTAPTGPAKRVGVELSLDMPLNQWLMLDMDASLSRARYAHPDIEGGAYVPEAIEQMASMAILLNDYHQYFGGLKFRYLGSKALTADNSIRATPTSLLNLKVGKKIKKDLDISMDILNVFNAKNYDIEYYYTSRLQGESANGVDDYMVHPTDPMSFRMNLTYKY